MSTDTTSIDWTVGDTLEPLRLPAVTRMDLIRYSGASGDFNPIHTVDEEASRAGLPGVIQHGMLTMAYLGRLFSPYLEQGFIREFRVRFAGMVFVGDELTATGTVTGREPADGGTLYTFDLEARNAKHKAVISGTATFIVFRP